MQPQSEIHKSKFKAKISNSSNNQQKPQSQRRELHRQQQQSSATATTTRATDSAAAGTEAIVVGVGQSSLPQRRATVKVIKCKKPLCHFKFYLDICDHQLTKRIEEQIRILGGALEFFLTPSVTHFITDKAILPQIVGNNNNNSLSSRPSTPQTPATPNTPQTLSFDTQDAKQNVSGDSNTPIGSARKANTRQTRADAILNRVRRLSATTNVISANVVGTSESRYSPTPTTLKDTAKQTPLVSAQLPYIVWQTEYALHFFKKVQHELKEYLVGTSRHGQQKLSIKGRNSVEPIDLKGGGFIKIEAVKLNHRPYYQLFRKSAGTEWPKIELTREDGAFRLSPKTKLATAEVIVEAKGLEKEKYTETQKMTRKSRSRSSQHQRPLPAAVQLLKKGAAGGGGDSVAVVKSSQRNSRGGAAGVGCKQVKETSDKQCGVCEICKIEYDTLTIHLKTKDHEYFAKNSQNFIALDTLIHTSADVNKFLNEDKKVELEEMEVENIEVVADVNEPDPLEGSEPLVVTQLLDHTEGKRAPLAGAHQTPSPTLREKSKRSTKGKHSSEKFQNVRTSKSPKATLPPIKPQTRQLKQQQLPPTSTTSSMLELQRFETCASTPVTKAVSPASTAPRRKPPSAAAVSPPIRAMLPPSSLYKVVEAPETLCTPQRKTRGDLITGGGAAVTASPSLIVKFKKVRATELHRLNGEAESFMFPKQRTSSDLPTDVDRQTTSENPRASLSSASLESTSDGLMEVEVAGAIDHHTHVGSVVGKQVGKRAFVRAKRRKSQPKQRFPIAPIQPEVQLKDKQGSCKSASTITVSTKVNAVKSAVSIAAAKANAAAAALAAITFPEATRKSSRTATAIVTAATTSSRLLRAAVEAAKHNNRQITAANEVSLSSGNKCAANGATSIPLVTTTQKTRRGVTVVKMEDRMGEEAVDNNKLTTKIYESDSGDDESAVEANDGSSSPCDDEHSDDDADSGNILEDDFEEDEEVDNDDEKDEDYIHCKPSRRKSIAFNNSLTMWQNNGVISRRLRAAHREQQKSRLAALAIKGDGDVVTVGGRGSKRKSCNELQTLTKQSQTAIAIKNKSKKISHPVSDASATPLKKQKSTALRFDYLNSERLNGMRYAFERIPIADLWYRVFSRQDVCSERYFEYYGSTNYRKLPYELGPIPFVRTLDTGNGCKLCEKQRQCEGVANVPTESGLAAQTTCKVKLEPLEDVETATSKSRSSSCGNANATTYAVSSDTTENATNMPTAPPSHSSISTATQYTHKHKKLHLLQRYRQEQQELQKQQSEKAMEQVSGQVVNFNQIKCDSKASTPDRERACDRQRAGSTHSTISSTSCTSSTATTKTSKNRYRNKHLNKAAAGFLNLELPPRKSPREHASTLALVSCIIKQRQDSQSKPNSETDEASPMRTPTTIAEAAATAPITPAFGVISSSESTTQKSTAIAMTNRTSATVSAVNEKASKSNGDGSASFHSPRHMRSFAVTPIEEVRFTTEISENVKRMRRGQNKYDHSPPIPLSHSPSSGKIARSGRQPLKLPLARPLPTYCGLEKYLHPNSSRSRTPNILVAMATTAKRRRRVKHGTSYIANANVARQHHSYSGLQAQGSDLPSIRKTGSKKGVLEFEVDATALKALDAATKHTNLSKLEWQIDKYLQLNGKEYDLEMNEECLVSSGNSGVHGAAVFPVATNTSAAKNGVASSPSTSKTLRYSVSAISADKGDKHGSYSSTASVTKFDWNTPPPTDCFSSDFDLYDLFSNPMGGTASDEEPTVDGGGKRKGSGFSLYSSMAMQNYFRKRKCLKSNRTGWPKVQKKKTSVRQQQKLAQKIRFLRDIGEFASNSIKEEPDMEDDREAGKEVGEVGNVGGHLDVKRENGVITPPESEAGSKTYKNGRVNGAVQDEQEADDVTELDATESIPGEAADDEEIEDDGETMADSMEEEGTVERDADADEEDGDGDVDMDGTIGEDEEEDDIDDDSNFLSVHKQTHHSTNVSPVEEKLIISNLLATHSSTATNTGSTSTPSTKMLRGGLRCTPQLLNGSLGSCISPSEKAGDNSDIFTVSSDGLDTDLDMSNSQHKCDDEHLHHHHHHHHHHQEQCANHQTPKRKFDLSKYAPNNATSSSCAAEAATAAVKSLAISQFLKKEVRVTCRRLRAPFRRYRYRR